MGLDLRLALEKFTVQSQEQGQTLTFHNLRLGRRPNNKCQQKKPGDLTYPLSPRFGGRGSG